LIGARQTSTLARFTIVPKGDIYGRARAQADRIGVRPDAPIAWTACRFAP